MAATMVRPRVEQWGASMVANLDPMMEQVSVRL